jgi:hypothetical protein
VWDQTVRVVAAEPLAIVGGSFDSSGGTEPGTRWRRPWAMIRLRSLRMRLAWLVFIATVAMVGCTGPSSTSVPSPTAAGQTGIRGVAMAGPVCPVEKDPPDPACAPRPVAGATIVIRDTSRTQVAAAVSGADGAFFVELQPGDYVVEPKTVQGLLGTAAQQSVTVAAGSVTAVQLDYDTGIR